MAVSAATAVAALPCFRRRWRSRLDLVVKRRGQWLHLKGFWPVWVRMWRLRDEVQGNFLLQ